MKKFYKRISLLLAIASMYACASTGTENNQDNPNHTHTFVETYTYDETYHWKEATCEHNVTKDKGEHDFSKWYVTEHATEETEGSKFRLCYTCHYQQDEVIPKLEHVHTFSKEWSYDETTHYHVATCGHDAKGDVASHVFLDDWTITKEATIDEEGSKFRLCYTCHYQQDEVIPKLEHVHTFSKEWSYDETTHYHVATCGHDEKSDVAGHVFLDDWTITKEASIDEEGSKERQCTTCEYKQVETIAKIPHDHTYSEDWSYNEEEHYHASTCGHAVTKDNSLHEFEDGICKICGYYYSTNGLRYSLSSENNTYTVTGINSNESNIVIPKKYQEIDVTSIGESAFENKTTIESITIPNTVTTIGDWAFYNCSNLTSIIIPEGVTTIGDSAFTYCSSLTSVTIGNSVTTIGEYAFYNCSSLTSVTIGNSVTTIGEDAFNRCSSLTSIEIPNSVTTIGSYAFYFCSSLTSVTIGNSVTTIGDGAFNRCSSLTSIEIPDSATTIGYYAFTYCSSLTSVTIGNSVTTIGEYAFYNCSNLTSIIIPEGVTTIGEYAFYNCTSLTIYCEATSQPSGWNSSWNYSNRPVYWGVTEENIIIEENGIQYLIINGEAVIARYIGTATEVVIPETITYNGVTYDVTTIGSSAFSNCSSLTSIVIPNSLTTIGSSAFSYCSSFTSVTIPNSVTTIGEDAFYYCSSLTIYCEVASKPSGWDRYWNYSYRPVYWYSETEPTDEGNYWHYNDKGEVEIWR